MIIVIVDKGIYEVFLRDIQFTFSCYFRFKNNPRIICTFIKCGRLYYTPKYGTKKNAPLNFTGIFLWN